MTRLKPEYKVTLESAIQDLNDCRLYDGDKWGVFFLGTLITMGPTKVYASYNSAKKRVVDEVRPYSVGIGTTYKQAKEVIDELECMGFIEIRQLTQRGPMFPRNIKDISPEQAERFEKMLDAPDEEMVNLAITILKEIRNGNTVNDK